ncbi:hypothetical protein HMPREF0742_00247 [Rothia aeria F0184]|uniref:Uncharacterized protein n=1 Tax=Rothia aeria F0184 TaxID=888019 RepID=U7V6K7_9MICC|nr:hypothetical protein HMPREF0742_00247 [Rothia aeria F0184]
MKRHPLKQKHLPRMTNLPKSLLPMLQELQEQMNPAQALPYSHQEEQYGGQMRDGSLT